MTSQLEQLLTCCICLDRFRNPKLLPCQHSVCMEPCMEGLVDYVRRQVKCPECRAEHRIPYNGVQGYPTNVTLQRFLEAHIEITGEQPDPHTGQIMERCAVCNEKNYLTTCAHCDKKICDDCKSAHSDILRREIGRVNNQVKRAMHRLKDQQGVINRYITSLKNNSDSVLEEIENINRRLSKAVRDRCHFLKHEAETNYTAELKNLNNTKSGLEQEISNAEANSQLADKHMSDDQVKWDDCELMDAKEIFLRTMEFIRNFDCDSGDYNRKARFNPPDDLNKMITQINTMGDLIIHPPKQTMDNLSTASLPAGLMKSKSDHRLAAQFRDQDDSYGGRSTSPGFRRKFGERPHSNETTDEYSGDTGRRRFRSRFMRREEEEERLSKYEEEQPKQRQKVIDTEDVSRGPLSGITRMPDSPRVIQRLQEKDMPPKKKREEPSSTPSAAPQTKSYSSVPPRKTTRQTSNEDEIDKIKKQNKSEPSSTSKSPVTPKSSYTRTPSIKEYEPSRTERNTRSTYSSIDDDSGRSYSSSRQDTSYGRALGRKTSVDVPSSSQRTSTFSRSSSNSPLRESAKSSTSRTTKPTEVESRSISSENSKSPETPVSTRSSTGTSYAKSATAPAPRASSGRYQSRFLGRAATPAEASKGSGDEDDDEDEEDETSEETDSEETEESSEEEREDTSEYNKTSTGGIRRETGAVSSSKSHTYGSSANDSGYNSRYGSSDNSGNSISSRYGASSSKDSKTYNKNTSLDTSKSNDKDEGTDSKYSYATGPSSSRAKFEELREKRQRLARSKSSAGVEDEETPLESTSNYKSKYNRETDSSTAKQSTSNDDSSQLSNWARYLKNKYGNKSGASSSNTSSNLSSRALSRSRSSHLLGLAKEDSSEDDSKNVDATPTTQAQAGILGPTPFGNIHRNKYLQKQRTILKIGSRGSESGNFTWPRGIAVGPNNIIVVADSSNHRVQTFDQEGSYLTEFGGYGSGEGEFDCLAGVAVNQIGQYIIADRYNHRIQIFDSTGSFLRSFGSQGNSDGKFSYPWGVATDAIGYIYVCDKENHRVQVFQSDGSFAGKFGTMGNKTGQLEHPHYVAVSSNNTVIVSDSNNHRVQMFDANGKVLGTFGSEGSDEGQFKFPRGVAVDVENFIFVADSGNNRIQIFNQDGTFIRAFGCWGSGDGEFKGLEGVSVMPNGRIMVCDRENHRVQVF